MSKILLIDDDPSAVSFLSYELEEEYKHYVIVIKNASDVIDMLSKEKFDGIILDIMMPIPDLWSKEDKQRAEMGLSTGAILIEKIRERYPKLPILIYSAKDLSLTLDSFSSYLRKPESIKTIVNEFKDLINK